VPVVSIKGVRRLFSRGGQNFPGGAKTQYLPKKHQKDTIFLKKSQKTYYFGRPGGREVPPTPTPTAPADDHGFNLDKTIVK